MSKTTRRMTELFADDQFPALLLRLRQEGKLTEGADCPSGCGGTLHRETKDYMDTSHEPWCIKEIHLLACDCGFQLKEDSA